jgi:hypothetical protein
MDHKTLFPVLDNGVFFFDILMKHAIRLASRYWQGICIRNSVKLGAYFWANHKFSRSPDNQKITTGRNPHL